MDARFYTIRDRQIDIEALAHNLVNVYQSQGYQAQAVGQGDHVLVQFKKGGDLEALIGLQASLTIALQRTPNGVIVTAGQQKWIDKAAVGALGVVFAPLLWPLAITAGAGALRQANLASEIFHLLDGLITHQYPDVQISPNVGTTADTGSF